MDTYTILSLSAAVLIAISGISVVSGVLLIKLGKRELHKRAMITASVLALLFVVLYLIKSSLYPPRAYQGDNRAFYLFVLWSHTILSIINIPLVIATLYFALKERFDKHKKVAPITAGVWIYVALTGWLIYYLLSE
jgi:putative membrane protein